MEPNLRVALQEGMIRLQEGDRAAFEPVYAWVAPIAYRFALRHVEHREDAEDITQQALLKVFERCVDFDPSRDALPWILGIVYYECLSLRKQRQRRTDKHIADLTLHEQPCPHPDPEALISSQELQASLLELMGTLRTEDIDALRASVEECERPPIAAATFRKRLQRALERLKLAWRKRHERKETGT